MIGECAKLVGAHAPHGAQLKKYPTLASTNCRTAYKPRRPYTSPTSPLYGTPYPPPPPNLQPTHLWWGKSACVLGGGGGGS